jgi:hypothetical protein
VAVLVLDEFLKMAAPVLLELVPRVKELALVNAPVVADTEPASVRFPEELTVLLALKNWMLPVGPFCRVSVPEPLAETAKFVLALDAEIDGFDPEKVRLLANVSAPPLVTNQLVLLT